MNEVAISVKTENGEQKVSARELYTALEITHRFGDWFNSLIKYGFVEGEDYTLYNFVHPQNLQEMTDYLITIEMAKQICMLQRSEKGRLYREYFLKLEKAWNTPEAVMARALQFANKTLNDVQKKLEIAETKLIEQQPKVDVYNSICESETLQDLQTVANTIGLKNIFKVLSADKILEKKRTFDGVEYYKPYSEYSPYFELKDRTYKDVYGRDHIRPRVYVTGRGLAWLTKKYKVEA